MSDYQPSDNQLLFNIWERLKKIDNNLEWIRGILFVLAGAVIGYILKH